MKQMQQVSTAGIATKKNDLSGASTTKNHLAGIPIRNIYHVIASLTFAVQFQCSYYLA